MPPFRTYLVLSILFFLVLLFDPKDEFDIFFEPTDEHAQQSDEDAAKEQELQDEDCSDWSLDDIENEVPEWLARRLTQQRLEALCEKIVADNGSALIQKLKDNVPAALFVLLPLMAFVLKLLYPLSKRYYVEHLLFVVHFHAFFFLMLIFQTLFSRLGALLALPESVVAITLVTTSLYIPVYLYKAMRRVYGQRHLLTIPKFVGVTVAYFTGILGTLTIVGVLAAFSI